MAVFGEKSYLTSRRTSQMTYTSSQSAAKPFSSADPNDDVNPSYLWALNLQLSSICCHQLVSRAIPIATRWQA